MKVYSSAEKRISFRRELLQSIFRIAVPVLAIIFICFFIMLSASFRQTVREMESADLKKISSDMSYVMENAESLSRDMIFNSEIQALLQDSAAGEQYPENSAASYYINGFVANRDFISCVVLTGMDQTLYSTERAFTNLSDFTIIQNSEWFRQLNDSGLPYQWTVCDYEEEETAGFQETPVLMLARPIYSLEDYTTCLGYLIIYLDNDYLSDLLDGFQFGSTTNVWLTDQSGSLIMGNPAENDYSFLLEDISYPAENNIAFDRGRRYAVGCSELEENRWYICMAAPYMEINTGMFLYSLQMLLLIIAIVFLLFFLASKTASSVSKPIRQLSGIMDAYAGGEGEQVVPGEDDYREESVEIQRIYESYRQMLMRIHTLIQENYIENLEKKDAELALLQTQINPHFLYNTLDSINWMALANDQDEISEMITALSDMFRLSLMKSSSSYITLKQEMEYVQSYLILQKFRQGDSLQVSVEMEEGADELYIPRFILQPLLENAIKYGAAADQESFLIDINVRRSEGGLFILVVNDGTGIDLKQMDQILDFDPDSMGLLNFQKTGYGVQNIHRRIKILCGREYGLRYYIENGRTCCEVILPVRETDA